MCRPLRALRLAIRATTLAALLDDVLSIVNPPLGRRNPMGNSGCDFSIPPTIKVRRARGRNHIGEKLPEHKQGNVATPPVLHGHSRCHVFFFFLCHQVPTNGADLRNLASTDSKP